MSDFKIIISKGRLNFEFNRTDLALCIETPDGISFKFKENVTINIEDSFMPSSTKQKISLADTNFKNGNLHFNLNDYNNPVLVKL